MPHLKRGSPGHPAPSRPERRACRRPPPQRSPWQARSPRAPGPEPRRPSPGAVATTVARLTRRRVHLQRAVLHLGIPRLPAGPPPASRCRLGPGGQQRRHHPVHRRAGRTSAPPTSPPAPPTWRAPRRRRAAGPRRPRGGLPSLTTSQRRDGTTLKLAGPIPRPRSPQARSPTGTTPPSPPLTQAQAPPHLHQRGAPLRRQRHHLHLQQLPLLGQPRLGCQGRHRRPQPALARRLRQRPKSAGVAAAIKKQRPTRSAISSRHPHTHRHQPQPRRYPKPPPVFTSPPPPPPSLPPPPASPPYTQADFSIVDEPAPGAYPICGYSWVLVSARQASQPAGQALVSLLGWLHPHDGPSSPRRRPRLRRPTAGRPATRDHHPGPSGPGPAGAPLTS